MLFAQSDWGVGQVFWSMLWFFLFVAWIVLLIRVFSDIMRSRELSGWGKAGWIIAILFLPFLGVFFYLIFNGDKMNQRDVADAEAANDAMQSYIRDAAGTGANPARPQSARR